MRMKYLFCREKKGNKRIIRIFGVNFTSAIVRTKCVQQKVIEDHKQKPLDIFMVAFNNAKLIEYQIKLLQKFVTGNYVLTIVDNSTQLSEAEKIFGICDKYSISYFCN